MRMLLSATSLIVALSFSSPAAAYMLHYCEAEGGTTPLRTEGNLRLMFARQDVVDSEWFSRIATAATLMNQNVSAFELALFQYDEEAPRLDDAVSDIFWSDEPVAPIVTYVEDCARGLIIAADLRLPARFRNDYVASDNKHDIKAYAGFADIHRPDHAVGNHITSAILHEFGHVAGLRHTSTTHSLMGDNTEFVHVNGEQLSSYIGSDTNLGLLTLYGPGAPSTDVSVTHWKFDPSGIGNEYSSHQRVQVFDASGNLVPDDFGGPERIEYAARYQLARGASYSFEFTFENNGLERQQVDLAFFLSEDDWIDTNDRLLHVVPDVSIEGLDQGTVRMEVPMPSDVELGGSYYVGAVVDPENKLDEQDEFNATYTWVTFVE